MIMKNINKLMLLGTLLITSSSGYLIPNKIINTKQILEANASTYALNFDGTYEVPLKLDLKMGQEAFSKTGKIEKIADNLYFTFTQVDNSNLADMKLLSEGKVGEMKLVEGKQTSYTYTVSEEDLLKPFNYSVIVTVMNKLVNFSVSLDVDNINYVSDTVDDRGERPARFIPVIETNAKEVEVEKGSLYVLPEAKATLVKDEIEVNKLVYFINGDNLEEVEVKNNSFVANKIGKYKVIYEASSDKYKTSLGNNTKGVHEFYINSKIGASALGKFVDPNKTLPANTQMQTTIITSGDKFDKIKNKFLKIADNYQVFEISFFDESGNTINLNGNIEIYLRASDYFNRNTIKLARFEDDTLTNLEVSNHGRYIGFEADKVGTYVAYVEGVEFNMPIWGYVLIACSILLVVITIVVVIVIFSIKKKKALKNIEEDVKNISEDSNKEE